MRENPLDWILDGNLTGPWQSKEAREVLEGDDDHFDTKGWLARRDDGEARMEDDADEEDEESRRWLKMAGWQDGRSGIALAEGAREEQVSRVRSSRGRCSGERNREGGKEGRKEGTHGVGLDQLGRRSLFARPLSSPSPPSSLLLLFILNLMAILSSSGQHGCSQWMSRAGCNPKSLS